MQKFREILSDISKLCPEEAQVKARKILESRDPELNPAWTVSQYYDFSKSVPSNWLASLNTEVNND